ncbi:MAG: FAD-dependent oxidoreductase [Candidatus Aenigmarchaeota archaeon]|nr:FAD-dependent oxidoreductase [Candidatus Aenigmarchaeota archaeon]
MKVDGIRKKYLASGATGRCGIRQQWSTEENIRLAMGTLKFFEKLQKDYHIEYDQGGYLVLAHTKHEVEQFKQNIRLQKKLGLVDGETQTNHLATTSTRAFTS